MGTSADLLECWRLNNAINLRLIDAISDAGMRSTMSTRGGRDVARQFVHLHNVRWAWLPIAGADLAKGVKKMNTKIPPTKAQLKAAHTASCDGIGRWIATAVDGYFLAHDAHYRGNILLTLKLSGHKVDTRTQYGIWMMWHSKKA